MAQPIPQTSSDSQLLNLRVPPHSIDAEQSVLGGLLIDNGAFDKIGDVVTDGDFYRDDHRRIFRHVSRLIERGKPADVVTVDEAIKVSEDKDKTGGITYLAALAGNTPSAHNVRRYAEIVRECAVLRKLIEVSTEIADSALNRMGKDVGQLLDEAESKVFQIAEAGARTRQGFIEIQPLLTQVMERIDLLYHKDNPSDITGIPTGYRDLDRETSGLQPGDLIIIAGRPSMGKTALALNMAEHVAVENKLPVAVFSMEMSGSQLAMRMLGSIGRLDQHKLRTGRLSDDDWNRLTNAVGKLHDAPILVDESGALNALELRARARRLHRQYGALGLIVVDYLQLMQATSEGENRATEISEISRSLKSLAKELKVPVVALSQLSRAVEQRTGPKRPIMSDLRESGAIEQDADLILAIYREEVYTPDTPEKGVAEIIILKQRNGPIGTVKLTFLGEYTRFESYAQSGAF
ncbi:MAG TPA: replicative DNA helicase [Burkholderiales bacterium]|jgi:replicative DNA helicase|nr:replicative DNA helicase [Burkholderiales bacterium]